MALINNPALQNRSTEKTTGGSADQATNSIYTANAILNAPKKISNRPVEAVTNTSSQASPFDQGAAANNVDFAKSMATTGTVGEKSTVQGQLGTILASGSPLLSRARTDSNAAYAERGLNNSSIGVQAGEEAVIRTALPIAQQDAQTYATQDLTNQNDVNTFAQQGLAQSYTDFNNDKSNAFTAGENQLSRESQRTLQNDQNLFTSGESALDRTQKTELFDKDQAFQTSENELNRYLQKDLQTDQQQFSSEQSLLTDDRRNTYDTAAAAEKAKTDLAFYDIKLADDKAAQKESLAMNITATYTDTINKILSDPNMTPSQAGAAKRIADENYRLNASMAKEIFGVDISAFAPTTTTVSGTTTTDDKGNVTKNFDVAVSPEAQQQATTDKAAANKKKEDWLNGTYTTYRHGKSETMTRRRAIEKGYLSEDEYKP